MAAPTILGLIGTGLAVEKLHWPALRGLADRSAEQSRRFADYSGAGPARAAAYRAVLPACDDVDAVLISHSYEVARDALTAARTCSARSRPASTRSRPRPSSHWRPGIRTASSWWARTSSTATQYRAGVRHIAQIRLLCGDIARVHGAVRAANSTIDAPSDLTLNLVFTGGAIGNYTASYPEIPVPPDFADAVQFGVRPVGSVAQSVANATVVQRALDSAERTAVLALDPVPGAGPVPLWRPCGSTGLFDGLPAQRISSSASFAA